MPVTPAASPPIIIGPFTNVPAPGSPIRSDWPQDISTYVANHLAAIQPFYQGVTGAGGTSGGAFANIQTITIPARPYPGTVVFWSVLRVDFGNGTSYAFTLRRESPLATISTMNTLASTDFASGQRRWIVLTGANTLAANTSATYTVRGDGTANVTTYGDPTVNRLDTIFIPTHTIT